MLDNKYELHHLLGKGGSSQVFSAIDREGNKCAIKVIRNDKDYTQAKAEHFILRENFVMEKLGCHNNLLKSIACSTDGDLAFDGQSAKVMYHVLEYCSNGTLRDFVKHTGAFDENIAKFSFIQIVSAVQHLHQKLFVHMDLKLENILLDEFYNIRLADLGTTYCVANTNGLFDLKIGTPRYMAPEVASVTKNIYQATKADIYSLGVSLYLMLTGTYPEMSFSFETDTTRDSFGTESTISNEFKQPSQKISQVSNVQELSQEACDLLRWMLQKDPTKRPSIEEVAQHQWFSNTDYEDLASEVYLEFDARKVAIESGHQLQPSVN